LKHRLRFFEECFLDDSCDPEDGNLEGRRRFAFVHGLSSRGITTDGKAGRGRFETTKWSELMTATERKNWRGEGALLVDEWFASCGSAPRKERRLKARAARVGIDNRINFRKVIEPHCRCGRGLQIVHAGIHPASREPVYQTQCKPCIRDSVAAAA
jgi:hypothetical protein